MKKKFLALVLTLAMVLSLVPATALATGTTQSNIDNPTPVESTDGYVKLEKTAAAVEESDNTFDITLKATVTDGKEEGAKTSTDAVLVIDRSGSMKGNRISSAQQAAKQFAEVVLGKGANDQNKIAVVSYADEAERNIDLNSDLKKVKNAINFSAYGGTNIQAGIKAARDILKDSTANNKVILVLSDGEPTYSFRAVGTATQTDCSDKLDIFAFKYRHIGTINPDSVKITGFDYNSTAGSGGDYQYDYTLSSWRDSAKLQVTCEHNKTESRSYPFYQNNGQPTIQEASYAKGADCEIYSIYLGKSTDTDAVSTMKGIATDETSHYKLATEASELGELFKGIAEDITLPVTPGMVTDPMGDHMNLVADSLQNNSAVTTNDGGFTWDLTKVTPINNEDGSRTYALTYQITFDTDFDGFNANTFYPTNQTTTLEYTVKGGQKTANFPIPAVKGKAATYQLTYDANGGDQNLVPTDNNPYTKNAIATLNYDTKPTHDQENVIFIGWSETKDTKIYNKGDGSPALIQSIKMDSNKIVYAVWGYDAIGENDEPDGVPDVFNAVVTYNIEGGTWDGTNASATEVIKVKEFNQETKEWTDTNNKLVNIPDTTKVTPDANHTSSGSWGNSDSTPTKDTVVDADMIYTYTLEAAPSAPTYTLTYNANGGKADLVPTDSTTYTAGQTANLKYNPQPTHDQENGKDVIFIGWSETNDSGKIYNKGNMIPDLIQSVKMDGNKTVYAVWGLDEDGNGIPDVFEATIIYKIENGQWTDGVNAISSDEITATFQLYEQQADHTWKATDKLLRDGSFPAGYTGKEGYTDLGWYRNSETTPLPSKLVQPTTKVIDAVTDAVTGAVTGAETVFTYKYAPTTPKTVVLHLEGGSYTTTPDTYTANSDGTYQYSVTETSAVINPQSPSRNNFGFTGWSLSKNAPQTLISKDATFASLYLEQSGTSGSFDKIDLYAVWKENGGGGGGGGGSHKPTVTIPDDVPTGLNGKDHYAYVVGYPDGMVYPQKNITRAEVATIFFRLLKDETREANMTKSNSYNDMKDGAWYTCAVSTLSKMGIIKGYEDGSFKPDASISRAEFAAIAARFDPDGDKTPATFSDVSSHWAKDEISIAANHGWIKGYEDGSFKPDQKITRAETMTLVNRVLKRLPETKDDLHKDMKTWPDNQNESAWFYLAVQEATNSHYQKLKKDGTHEKWESMRETRDWAALEK